ncbi:hypothetical protein ACGFI3_36115 [Nonomuraea wenchangensis]|uniref:hypothetical protein n=1 Tax=Nonomuraea wenchangensis TaxID=568860 RepID=UPI00371B188B
MNQTSTVEIPPSRGVLFAHGTCVILMEPAGDLTQQATILLREYGPVHSGTPTGDFNVIDLDGASGWAVTGHHPDILTYLDPSELENHDYLAVGILGRAKRDRDGNELTVLHHLEDKRSI